MRERSRDCSVEEATTGHGVPRALHACKEVGLGWIEVAEDAATYRMAPEGQSQRDEAERLADEYCYAPWAVLGDTDVDRLHRRAERLLERLSSVLAGR